MPEVPAAATAADFDAHHAITGVGQFFDIFGFDRLVITWPAGARIEFRLRRKERQLAGGAHIGALLMVVVVLAGKSLLGTLFAQNLELCGSQYFLPFGIGFMDFLRHRQTRLLFPSRFNRFLALQ